MPRIKGGGCKHKATKITRHEASGFFIVYCVDCHFAAVGYTQRLARKHFRMSVKLFK